MANVIEVEPDTKNNSSFHFMPIARTVRGRFDFRRVTEPQALLLTVKYPEPIPGQRLGLDLDAGEGFIAEPLHEPAHKGTRATIEKDGFALPPAKETFPVQKADYPTWLYWLKRAVESGLCKLVRGELPAKIEGKPRKQFITTPHVDKREKTIDRLTALLFARLPANERKAVQELLDAEDE
jgi:hypothetical protein